VVERQVPVDIADEEIVVEPELEEADVVWAAGFEALDTTELLTVEEVVWVSEVEVAAAKDVLSDTEVVDIMRAVAPNSYICKFSVRNLGLCPFTRELTSR
jgi:hypothetical protein